MVVPIQQLDEVRSPRNRRMANAADPASRYGEFNQLESKRHRSRTPLPPRLGKSPDPAPF